MTRSIVEQAHDMYDAVPYEVPVPDESLYTLLDDAARLYPDRIALDYFGATTTYAQVHDQVLKAARVLHEAGVGPGDTVAIALPNCPQAFVAFYACMRIGAIAAQHNPLAPAAQIAGQSWPVTAARWRSCGKSAWMPIRSAFSTPFSRWIFLRVCPPLSVSCSSFRSLAHARHARSCVAPRPRVRGPGTAPSPRRLRLIRRSRCLPLMIARSFCTRLEPMAFLSPLPLPTATSGSTSISACFGCGSCTRVQKPFSRFCPTSTPSVSRSSCVRPCARRPPRSCFRNSMRRWLSTRTNDALSPSSLVFLPCSSGSSDSRHRRRPTFPPSVIRSPVPCLCRRNSRVNGRRPRVA